MNRRAPMLWLRVVQWLFYGGFTLLLVVILLGILDRFLSPNIATRVAYNSEAYLFAIVIASWIQFGLPRIPIGSRVPWGLVHGVAWAGLGIGLMLSGWPSRIVTLNEAAFALAVLIPYVSLQRPLPRWGLSVIPVLVGLTVWAVVWSPGSWVVDQAETFAFLGLAILTVDVFDKRLLRQEAQVDRGLRSAWYAFLILEPIIVSGLGVSVRDGGSPSALALQYLGRLHESFIGVLLVSLILHMSSGLRAAHVLRSNGDVRAGGHR